jgi:2-iminoacetate synthase ThiH
LRGGANDFGGTLMEETISRMAGAEWGIRMEPRQFRAAIRAIGRTPVERTTTYEHVARTHEIGVRNGSFTNAHTVENASETS